MQIDQSLNAKPAPPSSPQNLAAEADRQQRKTQSGRSRAWKRFRQHRIALISFWLVALMAVVAFLAPVLAPTSPTTTNLSLSLHGPSWDHWLGTDEVGRDILSRTMFGARISLSVGLISVGIAVVISIFLGTISGFYGGLVDGIIMRFTDVVMCIPGLVIVLALVSILGPGIFNIMIAIGVLGWTGTTRLMRGQILSVRERDYVFAARALGASNARIMSVHVIPNCLAPILVSATLGIAGAILTEAALSFLGFGVVPPDPSWGGMLNSARSLTRLQENPWVWLPPGVMILVSVLAINFIGDGIQDALDPKAGSRS